MCIRSMEKRKELFYIGRKVGLDSGILIDLIDNPEMFHYQFLKIFRRENTIFTSVRCIDDTVGVLINRKNYSPEQTNQIVNQFLCSHNINKIPRICNLQDIEEIKKTAKEKGIEINEEDLPIIADFRKYGINRIFTKDENFAKLCKAIGIDSEKMPVIEKEISRQFYQLFKDKYRKFKKKY
jgi:predicted nucleic acid-binding protein